MMVHTLQFKKLYIFGPPKMKILMLPLYHGILPQNAYILIVFFFQIHAMTDHFLDKFKIIF